MRTVIANSALHLRLEREGWRTVYLGHGTATLVPPHNAERAAISTGAAAP